MLQWTYMFIYHFMCLCKNFWRVDFLTFLDTELLGLRLCTFKFWWALLVCSLKDLLVIPLNVTTFSFFWMLPLFQVPIYLVEAGVLFQFAFLQLIVISNIFSFVSFFFSSVNCLLCFKVFSYWFIYFLILTLLSITYCLLY